MNKRLKCGIYGCGRVGRALSVALKNSGFDLVLLVDRNPKLLLTLQRLFPKVKITNQIIDWPKLDLLFITVSDGAIKSVAESIAESSVDIGGAVAAHTNGSMTSDEISSLKSKGCYIASMHPVQSLSGTQRDSATIRTSFFALEGEEEALSVLKQVIEKMGGRHFDLRPEHKESHHLACVMAANYVITLMKMAADLLKPTGLERGEAKNILLPLMKNCLDNIERQGLPQALTGPIVRGDVGTVRDHLRLLNKQHPELLQVYTDLGLNTVELARELRGDNEKTLKQIRDLLKNAQKGGKF